MSKLRRFWPLFSRVVRPASVIDVGKLVDLPSGFLPTNPGLTKLDDGYLVCVRGVNYIYRSRRSLQMEFTVGNSHQTVNRFLKLDADMNPVVGRYSSLDAQFDDYEDVRLFRHQERLFGVANRATANGNRVVLISFDQNLREADFQDLESPFSLRREKNWSPFSNGADILFVHSFEPWKILRYVPRTRSLVWVRPTQRPGPPSSFLECGSTPGVQLGNNQLFVTHRRHIGLPGLNYVYSSRLSLLAGDMTHLERGPYFSVGERGIQFVSGLLLTANRTIVAYGVRDREALLATFDTRKLMRQVGSARMRTQSA